MTTISWSEVPPTVHIPPLWCPIPHTLHPKAEGADARLFAWARRFDLVRGGPAAERFRAAGYGHFCSAVYPRVVRLDLMSQWCAFNWIIDDLLDEGHIRTTHEERVRVCREVLGQMPVNLRAPRATSPLTAAAADLWQRTARPMTAAWRRRFRAHWADYAGQSMLERAPERQGGGAPWASRYTQLRRRRISSGCEMSFDLVEAGSFREVPEEVVSADVYEAVRAAASDAIAWTNDLYSIAKETARGDRDHLVPFLARTGSAGWDGALADAAGMIKEATVDFLLACRDLRGLRAVFGLGDADWAAVEESLRDLGDWIAGSLYWHRWSPRYSVVETTARGQAPSYLETHLA